MKSFKTIIGKNNYISPRAIIHDSVIIGDNNKIYDNVIIYPKTVIRNNNKIFPRNIIGEIPPTSDEEYHEYNFEKIKGVHIGNNNLLHVENGICSGIYKPTSIGNNNKLLAHVYLAHDIVVKNNVTFYPKTWCGGYSIFLDNSNIGMGSVINQRIVVGQYSMIGSHNTVTKHVPPYFISINNKLHRLNNKKNPHYVNDYELALRKIYNKEITYENENIPIEIKNALNEYMTAINHFSKNK
jgi:UDP-N-acetylglucosamine acyltransferase